MAEMKKYDGFRGPVAQCRKIWDAWEGLVGRRTDGMTLAQYASAGGLYWNGNKMVPETAPNDEVKERDFEWWMNMLNTDMPMRKAIKAGIIEWNGENQNQLTSEEIREMTDTIFRVLEDEGHV